MKNTSILSHVQSVNKWWNSNIKPCQILDEDWDQDRMAIGLLNRFGNRDGIKHFFKSYAHVLGPEFKIHEERTPFEGGGFLQMLPFLENLQSYYTSAKSLCIPKSLHSNFLFLTAEKAKNPCILLFENEYTNLPLHSPCFLPSPYSQV